MENVALERLHLPQILILHEIELFHRTVELEREIRVRIRDKTVDDGMQMLQDDFTQTSFELFLVLQIHALLHVNSVPHLRCYYCEPTFGKPPSARRNSLVSGI